MRIYWTPEQSKSWVIEDDDGSVWSIPAGGGARSTFAGDRALLQPIDEAAGPPWLVRIHLVGVSEIARRLQVQPDTVKKWRQRHDDFPVPLTNLAAGPVWNWTAVERWFAVHQDARGLDFARSLGKTKHSDSQPSRPPWDPATAKLFSLSGSGSRYIAIPTFGPDAWPTYIEGYRQAGKLLFDVIARTGHDQDFLLYPLVFAYRQYLELHLKLVIQTGLDLHGGRTRLADTHSLAALFDIALDYIEKEWPDDDADTGSIRRDLVEFDALDRGSYAFRFPVNKEGGDSLVSSLRRFSLDAFVRRAEEIGGYLDGASEGFMVHRDAVRELEAEYAP